MASGDDTKRGRRGYHHGDLKRALRDAARKLIAEKGPSGFTIAEAARAVGVSPSAMYRHFADRDALLADVALEGFREFAERLEAAWADPRLTPLQGLDALGRAYLAFAAAEPAAFMAMFEAGLRISGSPTLRQEADRAFDVLHRAVAAVAATVPPEKRPPTLMAALHIWTLSHGVATLFARGAASRTAPMSPEDMLESAVGVYLRGLGLIPRDEPANL
ncbi:MAG: TetR/AcrR family transcriptional regulator [Neomegalonema sp.]|nr:TetR/AcrR family transcriptional regulator [Neomegalonema sp.]